MKYARVDILLKGHKNNNKLRKGIDFSGKNIRGEIEYRSSPEQKIRLSWSLIIFCCYNIVKVNIIQPSKMKYL